MPTTVDIESQRMLLGTTPVRKLYRGASLIGTRTAELFAGGVPGVWFDPSDFSTMYQDTDGTLPVTGVEQPVGLLLDKSRGGRGPNLTPPTYQLSGWLGAVDNTVSNDGGGVVSTNTVNTRVALRVANIIQPGVYEVEVDLEAGISSTGATSIRVAFSSSTAFGGSFLFPSTMTTIPGTGRSQRRAIVTVTDPTHSGLLVGSNAASEIQAGSWIKLHSVSVRRIDGNHASQATTTARPILSAKYNVLSSSANVSATPWTSSVGTFSFAPTAPYVGGEAYRVTNNGTGTFRFIAHPFTAQVGTYTVSAIVEEDIANPSEYTDIGLLQAPSTILGRIRIYWPTGAVGTASGAPLNARRSLLSAVGPNGGRVFSIQFEIPVTAVEEHRVLFYPSSTTQNTTGVILHCVDVRLFVDAALPSFQPVVSQTEYQIEGFPYYLQFDGVDDLMSTAATVNLSSTSELVVMTAVNVPPEQTARATVLELGASYANPGCVGVEAPMFTATSVGMGYRGNGVEVARSVSAGKDPIGTVVFGATLDLNAPLAQLRVNSANKQQGTLSVGPGPFANATLFLGARNGNGQRFKGRLYGAVICGKRVLSPELNSLEQFLRNKSRAY